LQNEELVITKEEAWPINITPPSMFELKKKDKIIKKYFYSYFTVKFPIIVFLMVILEFEANTYTSEPFIAFEISIFSEWETLDNKIFTDATVVLGALTKAPLVELHEKSFNITSIIFIIIFPSKIENKTADSFKLIFWNEVF
jgi:hypothetical protein